MKIQINTDKNIIGNEDLIASSTSLISHELSRYTQQITRVEVHFSEEDGNKNGVNDKRCMVEARLEGMKPIAVINQSNSHEQAFVGAIDKLKASLKTKTGRIKNN